MPKTTLLLTCLGTTNYHPADYQIDGTVYRDETYFSIALAKHLRPDHFISLQTYSAAEIHGLILDEAVPDGIHHTPVSIPDGKSEDELWQIFRALTESVPEGCRLHLDITHGFRSLPMLAFTACSFLRVTRRVEIVGIHYGAWDARNEKSNATPAFDLTPFLTLLDWSSAADQFLDIGDATRAAALLEAAQNDLWKKRCQQ